MERNRKSPEVIRVFFHAIKSAGKQRVRASFYRQMAFHLIPAHLEIYDVLSTAFLVEWVNPQARTIGDILSVISGLFRNGRCILRYHIYLCPL
jgi:hypothetical protein